MLGSWRESPGVTCAISLPLLGVFSNFTAANRSFCAWREDLIVINVCSLGISGKKTSLKHCVSSKLKMQVLFLPAWKFGRSN